MAVTRLQILNMIALALLGVVILVLSLITANSLSTGKSSIPDGGWEFYLGRRILPDNILYPLVIVQERIELNQTPADEQVVVRLAYAQERFETAKNLLEINQPGLATSTLSKSQKYIISAGYLALEQSQISVEQMQGLRNAVDHSIYRIDTFISDNPQMELAPIGQLQEETRILLLKIDERLTQMSNS